MFSRNNQWEFWGYIPLHRSYIGLIYIYGRYLQSIGSWNGHWVMAIEISVYECTETINEWSNSKVFLCELLNVSPVVLVKSPIFLAKLAVSWQETLEALVNLSLKLGRWLGDGMVVGLEVVWCRQNVVNFQFFGLLLNVWSVWLVDFLVLWAVVNFRPRQFFEGTYLKDYQAT